jgi:hypothetical protein
MPIHSTAPAIQISLIEPVIFLRSSSDSLDAEYDDRPAAHDERGTYEHLDGNLNQLRGLVILDYCRIPTTSTNVKISFRGVSIRIDCPGEGKAVFCTG